MRKRPALLLIYFVRRIYTVADIENFGGGMQKFKLREDTTQNIDVRYALRSKLGVETSLTVYSIHMSQENQGFRKPVGFLLMPRLHM